MIYEEEPPIFPQSPLEEVQPTLYDGPEIRDGPASSPSSSTQSDETSHELCVPGSAVLVYSLGGEDHQDLVQSHQHSYTPLSSGSRRSTPEVQSVMEAVRSESARRSEGNSQRPAGMLELNVRHDSANDGEAVEADADAKALENRAKATIAHSQGNENEATSHSIPEERPPLTLQIAQTNGQMQPPSTAGTSTRDTITSSPHLSKHVVPVGQGKPNTLALVQPTSPVHEAEVGSPTKERLPSFQQLTGQLSHLSHLNELAEAASQESRQQQYAHNHSQSFGSTTAQSPRLGYSTFPGSAQTSPASTTTYTFSARSPVSALNETSHSYGSPTQYAPPAYSTAGRRSSVATENAITFPTPLTTATSSGDSHGQANSSTDGYSTAQTTPNEQAASDGTPRPILPPPAGMPASAIIVNGGFTCDWPGCNAASFQTQYLLSSHKNVHSSSRPHYCPVQDCPRSEGGKGFKRKNEMIRHGLVHNSPGYICPFCPDREHKYPRPDNLQRHVRVHHVDKDRDDPALREVLAQRIEGAGKQRRRRTNTNGTTA